MNFGADSDIKLGIGRGASFGKLAVRFPVTKGWPNKTWFVPMTPEGMNQLLELIIKWRNCDLEKIDDRAPVNDPNLYAKLKAKGAIKKLGG
jgi:hypothetical protein